MEGGRGRGERERRGVIGVSPVAVNTHESNAVVASSLFPFSMIPL